MLSIQRLGVALAATFATGAALAQVVIIPDTALTPSQGLYSNAFGTLMVTTDGGNAANVGDPSGRNDDGFRGPIPFGYTLTNFFGQDYTDFFLNNNGNITFGAGLAAFTPNGPQGATQPVIAPFFGDVDTRGANSGLVYYNTSIPNETIITWDHVGYFGAHDDKLDTFQLVVRGPNFVIPAGEGQIGFFWTTMQWETGDASGGSGGFGGTPAAVGFGDGQSNGFVLQGSTANGIASVVNDEMIWFNINTQGQPVTILPEPETYALMLAGLALLGAAARRRRQG
ncbi:MAG TPA: nidogen-like domain-containing protein [Caldimonas sp.]|jgi:hypothetical protein|nr:nidogen-like domain-containing protein [Caldimonas sp.]HEX4236123.1 nidogen-like domain-containing protein [Caldimonas sp.]